MELKEGYITLRDLSIWFGLKPETISRSTEKAREKKLKKLKSFADYHLEGKRIHIDKVKFPTYIKPVDIIDREFPLRWGRIINKETGEINLSLYQGYIDTCARVGRDIWYNCPEIQGQISIETTVAYCTATKVAGFGHNYLPDKGTYGQSHFVKMDKEGKAPLTEEQQKIVRECAQAAYGPMNAKIAEIDEAFYKGELTQEQRDQAVGKIDTLKYYQSYIELLVNKLGFYPEQRTQLSFFAWAKSEKWKR